MHRTMLESKIHRATGTDCDLHYPDNQIINVDSEVATLLRATNRAAVGAPAA